MLDGHPDIQEKLETAGGDRERADILNVEAWQLRYNNPTLGVELAGMALHYADKANYPEARAQAFRNLGLCNFSLGRNDTALVEAQQALEIFRELGDNEGQASIFNLLGGIYDKLNKYDIALEYQHKALNLKRSEGDKKSAANILTNIGNIYKNLSQYDTALEYHLKALNISEELNDRVNTARTLNNVSAIYFYLGHYQSALKYLEKAFPIFKELGHYSGYAHTLGNIGLIHHMTGNHEKALEFLIDSLKIRQKIADKSGISHTLKMMGDVYYDLGEFTTALEHQSKALEFFKLLNDKAGQAGVYLNIAKLYKASNDLPKALEYCKRSIELSMETGDKNQRYKAHEICSNLYGEMGQFEEALRHFKAFTSVRDEVHSVEKQKAIAAIEFRYDMERVQREKEIYRLKNVELASALKKIEQARTELEEKNDSIRAAYKQIEEQQRVTMKMNRDLELANRKLQNANEQLVLVNTEKNEIMSIVAHDLKNPLTGVMLAADSMKQYLSLLTRRDILKYIDNVQGCAEQMMGLISNLLDVRMLEEGRMRFEMKELSVSYLAERIVNQYDARARKKQIALHFNVEGEDTRVLADEDRLQEVFENLFSNAIKYSPKEKSIWVNVRARNGHVLLEVRDEGPGISEEDMHKLFEKFARLSARPTAGESSSGLGLAISKKLVEEMKGRIWCDSTYGEGAVFAVEFPALAKVPAVINPVRTHT